jgi:mRNA-degrading endonuclease RelE of RelBE toxin-antitoxin system
MPAYSVALATQVRDFYATLSPDYRRIVKRAFKGLENGQGDRRTLHERLEGYHRLRVGPYRIIYRHEEGRQIFCDFVEARSIVYELFEGELIEKMRRQK